MVHVGHPSQSPMICAVLICRPLHDTGRRMGSSRCLEPQVQSGKLMVAKHGKARQPRSPEGPRVLRAVTYHVRQTDASLSLFDYSCVCIDGVFVHPFLVLLIMTHIHVLYVLYVCIDSP